MALAAVGRDCPGIVCGVSKVLYEHGCNVEDSSMTILRGEFAMILIVAVPERVEVERLREQLQDVAQERHLVLSFRELPQDAGTPVHDTEGTPYIVSVYGADQPGIVYRVTNLLAERNVNITDVNTRVVGDGAPVYIMILEVEVPAEVDLDGPLRSLAKELAIDITVRPMETAHL